MGPRFDEANREKLKSHKIAFLTEKLDLTPEEAQKFWPVYNQFEENVYNERENFRKSHDYKPEDILGLSNEEASEFIDAQLIHERRLLDMRNEFTSELKKIISSQKILRLLEAEREFKVELMKRMAGRQGSDQERINRR